MVLNREALSPPEDLLYLFRSFRILFSPKSTQYTVFFYSAQSYTYLSLGLKTAIGLFSKAMDYILGLKIRDFTVNYIDDLLIASYSFQVHLTTPGKGFAKTLKG